MCICRAADLDRFPYLHIEVTVIEKFARIAFHVKMPYTWTLVHAQSQSIALYKAVVHIGPYQTCTVSIRSKS